MVFFQIKCGYARENNINIWSEQTRVILCALLIKGDDRDNIGTTIHTPKQVVLTTSDKKSSMLHFTTE